MQICCIIDDYVAIEKSRNVNTKIVAGDELTSDCEAAGCTFANVCSRKVENEKTFYSVTIRFVVQVVIKNLVKYLKSLTGATRAVKYWSL